MAALAEDFIDDPGAGSPRRRLAQLAVALVALVAVGALAYGLRTLISGGPAEPKRQVAKIAILPDKPPPPPPPPKEEKRPEPPKAEPRPVQQEQAPKPLDAPKPANEPLKMEGAAGDGPSAFQSGAVTQDYAGGTPQTGPAASAPAAAPAPTLADRAQERLYAGGARALLRDEIERRFKSDSEQATATFSLWVESDGAIRRLELQRTGDPQLDGELDAALAETARQVRLPPPPAIQQPMRFRLTLRPQG